MNCTLYFSNQQNISVPSGISSLLNGNTEFYNIKAPYFCRSNFMIDL